MILWQSASKNIFKNTKLIDSFTLWVLQTRLELEHQDLIDIHISIQNILQWQVWKEKNN